MEDAGKAKRLDGKLVIGWTEFVDFPDWEFGDVKVKVDTGARTSALHVEDLEIVGEDEARFHVILNRRKPYRRVEVHAPIVKWARVRSSTGHYTNRCFVRARVRIGPKEKEIELSLVSREKMVYRMLLGRKALEDDFVVDVSRRLLLGGRKPPRKKKVRHG